MIVEEIEAITNVLMAALAGCDEDKIDERITVIRNQYLQMLEEDETIEMFDTVAETVKKSILADNSTSGSSMEV